MLQNLYPAFIILSPELLGFFGLLATKYLFGTGAAPIGWAAVLGFKHAARR